MDIRSRAVAGVAVLYVEGPLVTASGSTPSLRAIVRNQLRQGCLVVLINMAGVTDIDAHGIGSLVSSLTTLERHGGKMAIVAPRARVRQLLALTKLDTVFTIYDSEREAFIRNRPLVVPTTSCVWPERVAVLGGGVRPDIRPLPAVPVRQDSTRVPGELSAIASSSQPDAHKVFMRIAK